MAIALTVLAAAFVLRVLGQVVVVLAAPDWLPPMQAWQSGLLPYPVLLASQVAIIVVQVMVITAVAAERGPLAGAGAWAGWTLVVLAVIYLAGNTYRAWRRSRHELAHWWSMQLIPIIFHYVLATFMLLWGISYLT